MRYRLACFDLDGTIVDDTEFIWYTLHEHFNVDFSLVRKWRDKFLGGKISYEQWFAEDIAWWNSAGARKKDFIEAIGRLRLMGGARETIAELKRRGVKLAVISGSLGFVLEHFFPDRPFDHVFINELYFDHKGRISGYKVTPYDFSHKATGLRIIAEKEKIALSDCVFVGDNLNDIEAVKLAGLGISFNSKSKELDRAADIVVKKKDLREVLKLL